MGRNTTCHIVMSFPLEYEDFFFIRELTNTCMYTSTIRITHLCIHLQDDNNAYFGDNEQRISRVAKKSPHMIKKRVRVSTMFTVKYEAASVQHVLFGQFKMFTLYPCINCNVKSGLSPLHVWHISVVCTFEYHTTAFFLPVGNFKRVVQQILKPLNVQFYCSNSGGGGGVSLCFILFTWNYLTHTKIQNTLPR